MTAVARHIEEQNPVTNEGMGVKLIPLREGLARRLPQGAVDTDGRRRTGVADRLRQRGQPVAGAGVGADQRGRDTHGARRGALARLSAIAD